MMEFFEHAVVGFCWWDIPGLLALIAAIACILVRKHKFKEEKKELLSRKAH